MAGAFLFGGGSRADIASLVLLRPLAILLGAYALIIINREHLARVGLPFWLVLAVTLWAALQLVPLPPGIWTALPGRDLVAQISADLGMQGSWRPLTLSPGRTTNTVFAMSVPLAAFLLAAVQKREDRHLFLWPLLIAGAISAVLGLLQIIGPSQGALYLYRITNPGTAVGLFANRNHNALFLASLIPLLGYAALFARGLNQRGTAVSAGCIALALFIFPLILVNGSRAGAAAALATTAATATLLWLFFRSLDGRTSHNDSAARWIAALSLAGVAALVAATWILSRSLVFQRLFDESLEGEMRLKVLPLLGEMAVAYFPFGSGFGSFDLVYKIVEPDDLLQPKFLNHAHNDPTQMVIEGGLPALLIILLGLLWFLRAGARSWQAFASGFRGKREKPDPAIFAFVSLAALLAGGLVDYPLRTPALMCMAVLLCCIIAPAMRRSQHRSET